MFTNAYDELKARGFIEQVTNEQTVHDLLGSSQVTFYIGYDPTATSLHAGSAVTLMAMRLLQRHGHRPICMVGGGTGMIGDPSGKTETRKLLDRETIATNCAALRSQFERFIHFDSGRDNDALLLDNGDWLLDLRYIDFLREIGRHFTVNRMVAVKTYRDRLDAEIPLSFLEFNYQLLQAYDFLHLYREHSCLLQLGGSDQWGNMVAGVELIRRVSGEAAGLDPEVEAEAGQSGAFCLTFPLLLTADGKKMGKSERGAIWLDPERLSPFEYYQYWIKRDDRDVPKLLRVFTELSIEEIHELCDVEGAAMREATRRLAFEATRMAHGEEAAIQAEKASKQAYGPGDDWSAVPLITIPIVEIKLVDLLVHEQVLAFKSKREARTRIEGKAVRIDDALCTDPGRVLRSGELDAHGVRVKAGKRRFRICLAAPDAAT